jgi:hypothetical protein
VAIKCGYARISVSEILLLLAAAFAPNSLCEVLRAWRTGITRSWWYNQPVVDVKEERWFFYFNVAVHALVFLPAAGYLLYKCVALLL